jgi:hypothetical protein
MLIKTTPTTLHNWNNNKNNNIAQLELKKTQQHPIIGI